MKQPYNSWTYHFADWPTVERTGYCKYFIGPIGDRPFRFITARCTLVQSAVMRLLIVRLSFRPCVTFRYRDHIGWNSSKIILPGWPQNGPSGATGTPPKLGRNTGDKFNCGRIILLPSKMPGLETRPWLVLLFLVRGRLEIPASGGMPHKLCADCGADCGRDYTRNPDPQLFLRIDRNKSIKCRGN